MRRFGQECAGDASWRLRERAHPVPPAAGQAAERVVRAPIATEC
jgi:hypothetical protein